MCVARSARGCSSAQAACVGRCRRVAAESADHCAVECAAVRQLGPEPDWPARDSRRCAAFLAHDCFTHRIPESIQQSAWRAVSLAVLSNVWHALRYVQSDACIDLCMISFVGGPPSPWHFHRWSLPWWRWQRLRGCWGGCCALSWQLTRAVCTAAHVCAGVDHKNRYINILPNPESRVRLSKRGYSETTTYINANYVAG